MCLFRPFLKQYGKFDSVWNTEVDISSLEKHDSCLKNEPRHLIHVIFYTIGFGIRG